MWGRVPVAAVQEINQGLPAAWVCGSCGFRHSRAVDVCTECLGEDVLECPRQIWGWLGVQLYLHPSDFGLDFLRNGRRILYRDKRLFAWGGVGDALPVIEYPVEVPNAGRLVGEIHCDHVPINFAKNAFDYESADSARSSPGHWVQVLSVQSDAGISVIPRTTAHLRSCSKPSGVTTPGSVTSLPATVGMLCTKRLADG